VIFFFESLFDERFAVHRLKATCFAAVVTALAMAGYFAYEFYVFGVLKMDILVLLGVLAIAKIAAMTYYRFTG
jgi:hypothetical protein